MNFIIFVLLFSIAFSENFDVDIKDKEWSSYKETHQLKFESNEESSRKDIFWENYLYVKNHNKKESSYKLALNKLAHLRLEEISHGLKMRVDRKLKGIEVTKEADLPVSRSVDWRKYGIVAPIKDQKRCGSCYSFSAISAIESAWAKVNGYLTLLSEQEIVDCSKIFGNHGCEGGLMDDVYQFVMNQGVSEESQYRYLGEDEKCLVKNMTHNFKILSYHDIQPGNERELIRAVGFEGPVSVAIDASSRDFRFYESGIIDTENCSADQLNHGVVIVGYDFSGKIPYYIVRNSWGEKWGEKGYFKMAIMKNMCGIAEVASYPIVGP